MKRSAYILVLAGPLALLAAAGCRREDKVIARVGTKVVTASEFRREVEGVPFASGEYLRSESGQKELLELLVRRKLILSEAEKSSVASKPETRQKLAKLEAEVERQRQDARERIVVGEFIRSLQEDALKVPDEEVRRFWNEQREVEASH